MLYREYSLLREFSIQRKDSREKQRDEINIEDTKVLRMMNSTMDGGRRGRGGRGDKEMRVSECKKTLKNEKFGDINQVQRKAF